MAENSSTWLLGDAQVEFGSQYLGAGPVKLKLVPEYLNVRRDGMAALRAKRVTGLSLSVTAELPGPERLLEVLDSGSAGFTLNHFSAAPFAAGQTLKIYPADPVLRGFSFPSAFLRESSDATGNYLKNGKLTAVFECEANAGGIFFTRMTAGLRPTGIATRNFPDLTALSQALMTALATPLQAAVDTAFARETVLPGSGTRYALFLRSCRNFEAHAPHEVHFELLARGAEPDHDTAIARLAAAADWLYGFRPALTGFAPMACRIETMEFNHPLTVQGMPYRESTLGFAMLLA